MDEANQSPNHIVARGLCHAYGEAVVLEKLDLSMAPGDRLAIMGPSGSGKSTLLNCLAGLEPVQQGELSVLGNPMHEMNESARSALRRRSFGIVFQFFHLLPTLTALENVELPLMMQGSPADERKNSSRRMLESVGMMHRLNAYPETLSGGERQRVAIARALITRPPILYADEPTGNLDQSTSSAILKLLLEMTTENKTTFVMVTHSPEAAAICNRTLVLRNGQLNGKLS